LEERLAIPLEQETLKKKKIPTQLIKLVVQRETVYCLVHRKLCELFENITVWLLKTKVAMSKPKKYIKPLNFMS
jgi:hypothetical protein